MEIVVEGINENRFLEEEYSLKCQAGNIVIQQDGADNLNIWLINDLNILKWQGKTYIPHSTGIAAKALPVTNPTELKVTVELLLQAIPLIKLFPARHRQLLQLIATTGRQGIDLLTQNPAMAFLIVSRTRMLPPFEHYQHLLIKLLRKKRHQILELLHYPAQKWMAQLLARIPAHECNEKILKDIMDLYKSVETEKLQGTRLNKPATRKLKIIRHHIKYPGALLFTLLNKEKYFNQVSTKFLKEVGGVKQFENKEQVLYDLDEIARICTEELMATVTIPKINSLEELPEIHQNLTNQLNDVHSEAASRKVIFAPPVYRGTEIDRKKMKCVITPLQSGEELYQEGKSMNHCIFSYQPRISVSEGRLYAYHVQLGSEQASVLIAFPAGKPYTIVEARGPSNQKISSVMQTMLDEWLQGYSCE